MIAWLLVPLQYLFLRWRAENLVGRAHAARGRDHRRLVRRACRAIQRVEEAQLRFPAVVDRIDRAIRRDALRAHVAS